MLRAEAARMRLYAIVSIIALATSACGGASEPLQPAPEGTTPETAGPGTTQPESNQKVRAKIAAASLGSGGFGGSSSANVQLAFVSEASAPAAIAVVKVVLVDQRNGNAVETLQASAPSVWNGSTYVSWNERVTPGGDLRASYSLTTPNWSAMGSGSYSVTYKLRLTLSIDDTEVTIESDNLQREPEVAT